MNKLLPEPGEQCIVRCQGNFSNISVYAAVPSLESRVWRCGIMIRGATTKQQNYNQQKQNLFTASLFFVLQLFYSSY